MCVSEWMDAQKRENMAMKTDGKFTPGRRQFLRGLGAGAAVASAAPLGTKAKADSETSDEKRMSRYRESNHVRTYYRVNRYPN